jgi:hypothetical protein
MERKYIELVKINDDLKERDRQRDEEMQKLKDLYEEQLSINRRLTNELVLLRNKVTELEKKPTGELVEKRRLV